MFYIYIYYIVYIYIYIYIYIYSTCRHKTETKFEIAKKSVMFSGDPLCQQLLDKIIHCRMCVYIIRF